MNRRRTEAILLAMAFGAAPFLGDRSAEPNPEDEWDDEDEEDEEKDDLDGEDESDPDDENEELDF